MRFGSSWGGLGLSFEWKKSKVSDLIVKNILTIGDGYRAKNSELSMSGIPFARAGNINNGFQFKNADFFPKDQLAKVKDKISRPGDIVFTSKGTVGRFAYVKQDTQQFVYSPQLSFWRSLNPDILHSQFLYFWMQSREFNNQVNAVKGQTDMADYVSLKDQKRMIISIPGIKEQLQITNVLSSIDDKIELNNAINKNFEEMAQALFKRWFIDFEFPNENGEPYKSSGGEFEDSELGLIPKGWKVDTIGNTTSIVTRGIAPKYAEDTGKFVINQKCIRNGVINTDLARQHQSNVVTDKVVRFGDVLINSTGVGTLGRVAQVFEDLENYTVDSHVTIVRAKSENMICYLGSLLKRMQYDFENAATGSTGQTELGRETIKQMRILLPYDPIVQEYSNFYSSLYEKITLNQNENKILVQVRDTLLPKLMSGEIRVQIDERELTSSIE
jgi:type I restriction enzyme S subunit